MFVIKAEVHLIDKFTREQALAAQHDGKGRKPYTWFQVSSDDFDNVCFWKDGTRVYSAINIFTDGSDEFYCPEKSQDGDDNGRAVFAEFQITGMNHIEMEDEDGQQNAQIDFNAHLIRWCDPDDGELED